jgi:hypothetical protein
LNVTTYEFQQCRLLGHLWHIVPSDWQAHIGVPMTVRCETCNMERRDQIATNTGEVVSRRYVAPDRYYFHRDTDDEQLPTRTDFRMVWLEREIDKMKDAYKRRDT